jgi:hypothetical protein
LEKVQRELQKQNEKVSKKRQAEENYQANSKCCAHKEIAVLVDASLCSNEELALVEALTEEFLPKPHPSALTCVWRKRLELFLWFSIPLCCLQWLATSLPEWEEAAGILLSWGAANIYACFFINTFHDSCKRVPESVCMKAF